MSESTTTQDQTPAADPELVADLEDGEAVTAAEADEAIAAVGFVGCPVAGRLLRVSVASVHRKVMRVYCPHCETTHQAADALARELLPGEPAPELVELAPAEAETTKRAPKRSDIEVTAALPEAEWVAVPEFAERLGYNHKPLLKRLREMQERGQPLAIVPQNSLPTIISRVGDDPLPPTPPGYASDDEIRTQIGAEWQQVAPTAETFGMTRKTLANRLEKMDEFDVERRGNFVMARRSAPTGV